MLPLVPSGWAFESREGPLSEASLVRAHIAAPDLLPMLECELRSHWQQQALHLAVGGAVPLAGFLWLDWSVGLMSVALLLHVLASGLGDRLKLLLAGQQVSEELARTWELEHLDAVERAMARPRKIHATSADSSLPARHRLRRLRWVYRGIEIRQDPLSSCHTFISEMQQVIAVPFFCLIFPMLYSVRDQIDLTVALLFALGMLAEIGRAGFFAWRASKADQAGPELLPDGVLSSAVLASTLVLILSMWELIELLEPLLPREWQLTDEVSFFGLIVLISYLLSCLAIVIGWQLRNHRRIEALVRFAHHDRQLLRQKWHQLNGDIPGLALTHSDVSTG